MNYMQAYVSNWILPFPKREWYPQKKSTGKTKVMQDAYLEGFSVGEIANYFNVKQHYVYQALNIKALKLKKAERLEEKAGNL